ncbi:MAG TPA: GNAT family N-acetyltransferase [Acidobacteriota bacterium]|nr:GNAT family N-acetyltransferase [Acidobacteriota bacterium]
MKRSQSDEVMRIRAAIPDDRDTLFQIWLESVRATHTFLSEEDIQYFAPFVREYLASQSAQFWVLCSHNGETAGFIGLERNKIEALFLAPKFHRQGGGRLLVEFARRLRGELTVDVNEQNTAACRFYEACGFIVEGRSALDSSGKPFPLVHMRLPGQPAIS